MLLVQVRQAGFQSIYLKLYVIFEKYLIFPKPLYMIKIIVLIVYYLDVSCPGGVGAIMWACRARDSGSNPGQGAHIMNSI